ncbi:uncharacterized protein KRP23_12403 [Phytophthora ramorum]|uniref:uncharacterized protein n=1 Tax=Phytophthora ramorum TaxID=164328 RepID=UPI0030A32EA6|nr:hypothetical protein KRP23_12403 [Phytophthora ramorum]
MAARRMNAALRRRDWDEVRNSMLCNGADHDGAEPVEVCTASVDDWSRYVRSSYHSTKRKFMEWLVGRIWIVEYPSTLHGCAVGSFIVAMGGATGTWDDHLAGCTASHNKEPPAGLAGEALVEQDCAFGPHCNVGAVLPRGVAGWLEYQTVKVEVGVFQGWASLDRKAAIWRGYPGVENVVSIRLSPRLRVREYRFEQRVDGQFPGDNDVNRAGILPIDQEHAVL